MEKQQPVVLMILDGWGISEQTEGNAIAQSSTPNMDKLLSTYSHSKLLCSGEAAGQFGSRSSKSGCRESRISRTDPYQ